MMFHVIRSALGHLHQDVTRHDGVVGGGFVEQGLFACVCLNWTHRYFVMHAWLVAAAGGMLFAHWSWKVYNWAGARLVSGVIGDGWLMAEQDFFASVGVSVEGIYMVWSRSVWRHEIHRCSCKHLNFGCTSNLSHMLHDSFYSTQDTIASIV